MTKRIFQTMVVLAILAASFTSTGSVSAWSGCSGYITVQWGDTLSGLAKQCGTTVEAIRAANPGLGWWLYAGQVIHMPTGYQPAPTYGGIYVVQPGDTLGKIAARIGVSWRDLLAVNPQIQNPSLIYAGQVINLPGGVNPPPPPVYTPPPTNCNCSPSSPLDSYLTLKIAYEHGLFVRVEPGGKIISSGRNNSSWLYDPASVHLDSKGKVWIKVHLYPAVQGYSSGWMMVRDQLGKYFTSPAIVIN